ncbi:MAG: sterol desaturase family protein [Candidatus Hydrogenedentota bacterium]
MEYINPTSRAALATIFLAVLWLVEGLWPMYLARGQRGRHYARNLALGMINALVTIVLFAGAMLVVTEWSQENQFGLLHRVSWSEPVILIVGVIAFDGWQYLWHRINHWIPLLWRFHAVHHTDAELDASSGLRFHTGEIVLSSVARLAILPLLGLTMTQLVVYELILTPVVFFHHSNIRLPERVDRVLRWFIVTPRMHWVHHSQLQPETDSNYASILSIWDRIFGSYRFREKPEEIELGLEDFEDDEWRSLRRTLTIPFTHRFTSRDDNE